MHGSSQQRAATMAPTLTDFTGMVNGGQNVHALLHRAARTLSARLEVTCCRVYRPDASGARVGLAHGVTGQWSFVGREPDDLANRVWPTLSAGALDMLRTEHALCLRIDGDTAPFGLLIAYNTVPRIFSHAEEDVARSLVVMLSAALRRAHAVRDKARLNTVVAAATEAILEVTKDGRVFNCNVAARGLCARADDQLRGTAVASLFADADAPAIGSTLALVCQGTPVSPFDAAIVRPDGSRIDVSVQLSPVVLPDGRITAAAVTLRDLRERQLADRTLRIYADILEHTPDGVVVWRLDDEHRPASLRLMMANQAAEQIAGATLSQWIGRSFADVAFTAIGADDPAQYAAVARTGQPADFGECSRLDGPGRRWYRIRAFPLPDRCVGAVFHDVTEPRELSLQLQHAQRLEVLGRLAGGVAHDMNNVLTIIGGYAELLRQRLGADEAIAADLEEIDRASRSAHRLTRQLLAFGRRQVLRPGPVDLHAFLSGSRRMLGRLIGEDVELRIIGTDPVTVRADVGQLEQVLLNLAVNARDAMPAGGKLFLESAIVDVVDDPLIPAGRYGRLTVSDTGLGMDPFTLERIFEPFFTTKDAMHGTGLGLSTVHGIVKQSGGHISVTTEPGVGTTFYVYLPLTDTAVAQAEPIAAIDHAGTLSSHTALVVEDDDMVRELVGRILRRAGLTVLEAAHPDDALGMIARFSGSIDLLVTDVVMPRQSGTELASRLQVHYPELRVIFMSGYGNDLATGHCKLPPDAPFVQKPFTSADLVATVRNALQGGSPPAARPQPAPM